MLALIGGTVVVIFVLRLFSSSPSPARVVCREPTADEVNALYAAALECARAELAHHYRGAVIPPAQSIVCPRVRLPGLPPVRSN